MNARRHLIRHFGRLYWATVTYAGWTKNQMGITRPIIHKGRKPNGPRPEERKLGTKD